MILLQHFRPDQTIRTGVIQPYAGVTQNPGGIAQGVANAFAQVYTGNPTGITKTQDGGMVMEHSPAPATSRGIGKVVSALARAKARLTGKPLQGATEWRVGPPPVLHNGGAGSHAAAIMSAGGYNAMPITAGPQIDFSPGRRGY